jgi:tetratricopeptide (TPR) repeat protein
MTDKPQHDPMLVKLFTEGIGHQSQGNRSAALVAYKRIHRQFPGFVNAWTNASVVLYEMGRSEEALGMAATALALSPEDPYAYCAMANACQGLGRMDDAVDFFKKTLCFDPNHYPALTNLAGICAREGNFAEALEMENKAIQASPNHTALWGNRGHTKMRTLDMVGAEADLTHALELDANNAQARWNLAYVQLLQHRYQEAWTNFRARLDLDEWSGNKQDFGKPHWKGEALDGRTLLVYTEQGFGDTLQFARFIPYLQDFGGRVLLSTYSPLKRILNKLPGIEGIIIEGQPLPPIDLVVPQMELPVILNADLPKLAPMPPPELPECKPLPELDRSSLKVGLVWAGSPNHTNDALRSIDQRFLDELADIQGVAWYGLQKPPAPDPPRLPSFIDLSNYMGDFMDTALVIKQLNLVITVDTSMAHLAGFLGLPAIVLLPYMPDWRWGLEGRHTPWYTTLTLLRQPNHNDWKGVMGMLREQIVGIAKIGNS